MPVLPCLVSPARNATPMSISSGCSRRSRPAISAIFERRLDVAPTRSEASTRSRSSVMQTHSCCWPLDDVDAAAFIADQTWCLQARARGINPARSDCAGGASSLGSLIPPPEAPPRLLRERQFDHRTVRPVVGFRFQLRAKRAANFGLVRSHFENLRDGYAQRRRQPVALPVVSQIGAKPHACGLVWRAVESWLPDRCAELGARARIDHTRVLWRRQAQRLARRNPNVDRTQQPACDGAER